MKGTISSLKAFDVPATVTCGGRDAEPHVKQETLALHMLAILGRQILQRSLNVSRAQEPHSHTTSRCKDWPKADSKWIRLTTVMMSMMVDSPRHIGAAAAVWSLEGYCCNMLGDRLTSNALTIILKTRNSFVICALKYFVYALART